MTITDKVIVWKMNWAEKWLQTIQFSVSSSEILWSVAFLKDFRVVREERIDLESDS